MTLYLDNAASSHPKPPAVYAAVDAALHLGANPGRAGHGAALSAARLILTARERVAKLFGVADPSRIVFTANATHAVNQALFGFLRPGDHVVTSTMEHNSVMRPLAALAQRGVAVTAVAGDAQGFVRVEDIERAIRPETRLAALSHASNVCGTILDAGAVGALCRARGIRFLLDASQTAGALPIDVAALGVDFLAAPGHKSLLGPQGTGVLYVAPEVELAPLLYGGTGSSSESPDMPDDMPERLEAGTLNTPGIAGLSEGVAFLLERTVEGVRAHERALVADLLPRLASRKDVIVYGPHDPDDRVAVVSFNLAGRDGAHVGFALDEAFGIAVRVGLHCAPDAHKTLGTFPVGSIRASFGVFNEPSDVDRLVDALDRILSL